MPTKIKELEEIQEIEKEDQNRFFETARKVVLAGIGAVGLAQDEIEDFVDRLVERGQVAEKDGRKLLKEVTEKRRKTAEHGIDKQMEKMLERMSIPSKSDIDDLSKKITELTAKVEDLKKHKTTASRIVAMSFCEPRSCRLQLSS